MKEAVIINVGVDYWYEKGTRRLKETLEANGFSGDIMCDTDYPDGCPTHVANPYAFKVYQFEKAINMGYRFIIWMDCSMHSSPTPDDIIDVVRKQGYYFVKNGLSVGQETNDYTLDHFGVTRDDAMGMPQICSGFFGLDMNKVKSRNIFRRWKKAMLAGCFVGDRNHSLMDSNDPRFLWHRQDQSSLSLCLTRYPEMVLNDLDHMMTYDKNKTELFLCQGM